MYNGYKEFSQLSIPPSPISIVASAATSPSPLDSGKEKEGSQQSSCHLRGTGKDNQCILR
ncbi:hypothetical protein GGP41_004943 [Bipolaris sorokiniana]|uniref:Uncharacterized protein n=1 Tax=Cochliobolus sativus TaxID=45130 RepID=A0A8H5Z940_COCSA|nr:hypothetical protein GGP41_004943 [Bipolaris sorokiniana]